MGERTTGRRAGWRIGRKDRGIREAERREGQRSEDILRARG